MRSLPVANRGAMRTLVDGIRSMGLGALRYHSWTGDAYVRYPGSGA